MYIIARNEIVQGLGLNRVEGLNGVRRIGLIESGIDKVQSVGVTRFRRVSVYTLA